MQDRSKLAEPVLERLADAVICVGRAKPRMPLRCARHAVRDVQPCGRQERGSEWARQTPSGEPLVYLLYHLDDLLSVLAHALQGIRK